MPLRCIHCQELFPVAFNNLTEAKAFQQLIQSHLHPDLAPDFDLVDDQGVDATHSSSVNVKEEELKLSRISQLVA
jgi:hypothetical protein